MITSINSSRSPPMSTSNTPVNPSILSFKSFAIRRTTRSGTSPESAILNTGNNATLTSLIEGSSVSAGNLLFAVSTFSRTSRSAWSESKPASNSSVTDACPSPAIARISLIPSIDLSSFSIGRANKRSASSGEIP